MKYNFKAVDPEIYRLIKKEEKRQKEQIELIPSENYVSPGVLRAVGSVLMNKYSEGQPFKRYYQGNVNIDEVESLVKKRALKAFKLSEDEWGINVQAVTGSIANLSVYNALLKPHDKIMGMFLYDGGHLSHGWKLPYGSKKAISISAKFFTPVYYYVDIESEVFDYAEVAKRAKAEKPRILISGGTAYPREINHKAMRKIADSVGAYYMADIAHESGLVLAGVNSSPFPYADIVTMTTRKTLRGPIGAMIFSRKEYSGEIDESVFPGMQGGPQNHSIAGIGVALKEAMQPSFKSYAKKIVENAKVLAEEFVKNGYHVVSGGTDKHLILVNLKDKGFNGAEAAIALEKANIILNKNTVPKETGKPWKPSGIRFGTPKVTSRGMGKSDMKKIAVWMDRVLRDIKDESEIKKVGKEIKEFAREFPTRK